jgi:hypothetical protein
VYTKENGKTYTGTKTLHAWPATKAEYCAYRGWTVPTDEDASEAGYLVEYEPDGKPNHPNHDGYVSWSPANVFDKTYFETPGDWKSRLIREAGELAFRLDKLNEFLQSPGVDVLPDPDAQLLRLQRVQMDGLLTTLKMRLERAGVAS